MPGEVISDRPVVVAARRFTPNVLARLAQAYRPILNDDDRVLTADDLLARADGATALLVSPTEQLSASVIDRLPAGVRIIATVSVGYDHVDLGAARRRGVVVTNTPDVLSDATAELALLLMLGAARRASEGERLVRSGQWNSWSPTFLLGTQMSGKRLGIVGMGRIGQVVARRARGFDMEIHYHNRRRLDAAAEAGATYHDSLDSMLPVSDFLSLHCPNTPETRGLLDARAISLLPDGAIVVNTARGSIVDDEALVAALRSGKLAAAGLDVFNGEPADIHPAYRELPNTFLLPHVGSATHETRDAMGFRALDNLDAFFAGGEPRDRVA